MSYLTRSLFKAVALILIPCFVLSDIAFAIDNRANAKTTLGPAIMSQLLKENEEALGGLKSNVIAKNTKRPAAGRVEKMLGVRALNFENGWVAVYADRLAVKLLRRMKELNVASTLRITRKEAAEDLIKNLRQWAARDENKDTVIQHRLDELISRIREKIAPEAGTARASASGKKTAVTVEEKEIALVNGAIKKYLDGRKRSDSALTAHFREIFNGLDPKETARAAKIALRTVGDLSDVEGAADMSMEKVLTKLPLKTNLATDLSFDYLTFPELAIDLANAFLKSGKGIRIIPDDALDMLKTVGDVVMLAVCIFSAKSDTGLQRLWEEVLPKTARASASGLAENPYHLFAPERSRGDTSIDENTVIIGTGGGDCAGLTDLIAQLVIKFTAEGKKVLGIKNCYDGMTADNWEELLVELKPEMVKDWKGLPSTVLGSCRRKISLGDLMKVLSELKKLPEPSYTVRGPGTTPRGLNVILSDIESMAGELEKNPEILKEKLAELRDALEVLQGLPEGLQEMVEKQKQKLKDLQKIADDLLKIKTRFGKAKLVITGGNDHLKAVEAISKLNIGGDLTMSAIGIPKSIDDDYQTAMLGFKSAFLLGRRIAARASLPYRDGNTAVVFEVMGRNSGSLTLECSKACKYPKAVIIPEKPVKIADIVRMARSGIRNFFVSEGFLFSKDDELLETLWKVCPVLRERYFSSKETDSYGNRKLTGASLFIVGILENLDRFEIAGQPKTDLKLKVERTDLTYALRGTSPKFDEATGDVFDSVLAEKFAQTAVKLTLDRQTGLALTYPDYGDTKRDVAAKPAKEVYKSRDLKSVSDDVLESFGVLFPGADVVENPQFVAVEQPVVTKEAEARALFYGINISTLAHRYANCVEFREDSEVIVNACGRVQPSLEFLPYDLKTIIEATRDSVLLLIPERHADFTEIMKRVLETYKQFGYVNVAISSSFTLNPKDVVLQAILAEDAVLKAKFDAEAKDAGNGLVRFDSGVSHFIIGLFKHLQTTQAVKKISTRITDIGYGLKGLETISTADALKDESYLAAQGVLGAKPSAARSSASGLELSGKTVNSVMASLRKITGSLKPNQTLGMIWISAARAGKYEYEIEGGSDLFTGSDLPPVELVNWMKGNGLENISIDPQVHAPEYADDLRLVFSRLPRSYSAFWHSGSEWRVLDCEKVRIGRIVVAESISVGQQITMINIRPYSRSADYPFVTKDFDALSPVAEKPSSVSKGRASASGGTVKDLVAALAKPGHNYKEIKVITPSGVKWINIQGGAEWITAELCAKLGVGPEDKISVVSIGSIVEVTKYDEAVRTSASGARTTAAEVDIAANIDIAHKVATVGITVVDLILNKKWEEVPEWLREKLIPGSLVVEGNIPGTVDESGQLIERYLRESLTDEERKELLDSVIGGGPAYSTARVFGQVTSSGPSRARFISKANYNEATTRSILVPDLEKPSVRVDPLRIYPSEQPTAKTLAFEHGDNKRSFLHNVGASADLNIDVFRKAVENGAFDDIEVVEFGGIELSGLIDGLDEAVRLLRERENTLGKRFTIVLDTVVDPAHKWKKFKKDDYAVLKEIDIFTTNMDEGGRIYGDAKSDDAEEAKALAKNVKYDDLVEFLISKGAKAVFLKMGAAGSIVRTAEDSVFKRRVRFHIPVLHGVKNVSDTGTGDAYAAGLVYAAAYGWNPVKAALFATVLGGLCLEHRGGTLGEENNFLVARGKMEDLMSQEDVIESLEERVTLDESVASSLKPRASPSGLELSEKTVGSVMASLEKITGSLKPNQKLGMIWISAARAGKYEYKIKGVSDLFTGSDLPPVELVNWMTRNGLEEITIDSQVHAPEYADDLRLVFSRLPRSYAAFCGSGSEWAVPNCVKVKIGRIIVAESIRVGEQITAINIRLYNSAEDVPFVTKDFDTLRPITEKPVGTAKERASPSGDYSYDADIEELRATLVSLALRREAVADRGLIVALDSALTDDKAREVAQVCETAMARAAGESYVNIRASAEELAGKIREKAAELKQQNKQVTVVTFLKSGTTGIVTDGLKDLGTVIRVDPRAKSDSSDRLMPIPGFFNLALEIDRYQRDKDPKRLLEALNSIAQNPQNGDPFTTDDVTSLLTQKIIVILPRTTPLRVAERVAEYGLMKKAAETSL